MKLPNGMVINLNKIFNEYNIWNGNIWVIRVSEKYIYLGTWDIYCHWNKVFSTE